MNHMQTTSKVRPGKKAAFKNQRPAVKTARERAECNPKPSWQHHTKKKEK